MNSRVVRTLGVVHRSTNKWWNINYLQNALKKFNNLSIKVIELNSFDKNHMPTDLDILAILPADNEVVTDFLAANVNLKWIHCMWAGVDKFLSKKEIFEDETITLSNARGAYADSLSEFCIFSMLYFSYNTTTYLQAFQQKKWIMPVNTMINKKTLTIVGYGLNGVELARKAKSAFSMNVIGVKKNTANFPGREYLDEIHSADNLDNVLPKTDFLVSILPHTPETVNMFNYQRFKRMKPSSVFINIGRGSSVDEDDLITALKEKVIKGAALDVFKVEPLPSSSPFYDLDNVFLSNHTADNTDEYFMQSVEVLIKNLEEYFEKGKPLTIVDKLKGY